MLILLDKIKIKELKSFNNFNYTIIIYLKAEKHQTLKIIIIKINILKDNNWKFKFKNLLTKNPSEKNSLEYLLITN